VPWRKLLTIGLASVSIPTVVMLKPTERQPMLLASDAPRLHFDWPLPPSVTASASLKPSMAPRPVVVRAAVVTPYRPAMPSASSAGMRSNASSAGVSARTPPTAASAPTSLPAGLACIRRLESMGNYAAASPYGDRGGFQYKPGTWAGYGGFANPAAAPPSVQDARALADFSQGPATRHQLWPVTSRRCGV
jgi:hypothetical protein